MGVNDLTQANMMRQNKEIKHERHLQELQHILEREQEELVKAKTDKEYTNKKLKTVQKEYEEKIQKTNQLMADMEILGI